MSDDLATPPPEQHHRALEGASSDSFARFLDSQRAPATNILFGLILGMFVLSTVMTVEERELGPLTSIGAVISVVWGAIQDSSPIALLRLGATLHPLVDGGEWWRLLAANYLHAGALHLFVNAYSLMALGPTLERIFGTGRFVAIWTVAGGTGALASVYFNRMATSVGASGALFGLMGAMLVLALRYRRVIPRHQTRMIRDVALITIGINLILGATIPNVDNTAHIGGLVAGVVVASLLGPNPALLGRSPTKLSNVLLGIFPLLALLALTTGLTRAAIGPVPAVPIPGPTRDYRVSLPLDTAMERTGHSLILRGPGKNVVVIRSAENPEGEVGLAQVPFTEATLEACADDVARRYAAEGKRLLVPPSLVVGGRHRFLRLHIALSDGESETIDVTATPSRIYAVRMRGLADDPWAVRLRDQVLATFEVLPEPN